MRSRQAFGTDQVHVHQLEGEGWRGEDSSRPVRRLVRRSPPLSMKLCGQVGEVGSRRRPSLFELRSARNTKAAPQRGE
jgi:hypothetical protein